LKVISIKKVQVCGNGGKLPKERL